MIQEELERQIRELSTKYQEEFQFPGEFYLREFRQGGQRETVIYTDLIIPKKRQELIGYLEKKIPYAENREKAEALLDTLEQIKNRTVREKSR